MTSAGKIVYVINHLDWFWSHRLPLARRARELGWEVAVAAPHAGGCAKLSSHGFRGIELPENRGRRPFLTLALNFWRIGALLRRERPAIVHAVSLKSALPAALAARWFAGDLPVVVTVAGLGYLFCSTSWRAKLGRVILAPVIRHAFTRRNVWVIFQNVFDRDLLARRRTAFSGRSVVIGGSGVDLVEFRHVPEPEVATPMVLMASRLVAEKGIREFAAAASRVASQGQRALFVLAGGLDQNNPAALSTSDMSALTKSSPIEWRGHVSDMASLYASSAIFVYPSYYGEGVPKVLLEAAATGRPIVTTDHPGCRDVVVHHVNGLLVPTRDPLALADAIASLLADPPLRAEMGWRSRERAVREFGVDHVVQATVAVYARALAPTAVTAPAAGRGTPDGPPTVESAAQEWRKA